MSREPQPARSGELRPSNPAVVVKADINASSPDVGHAEITRAEMDIFANRRPVPAGDAAAAPPPLPAAPVELIGPPLPPPPPPLNIQFAGRFRAPDGHALVYLRDGERFVVAKVGDVVSSGYQIMALLGDGQRVLKPDDNAGRIVALRFLYAPLRHTEIFTLPPEAGAP